MQAQYQVKVQMIRAKGRNDRFYVVLPMPLAAAIELQAGELVRWTITDRQTLQMKRGQPPKPRRKPRSA